MRSAQLTPANVAETMVADELIAANSDGGAIYADKAYDTHQRRDLLVRLGLTDGIMHRPNKHHPLTMRQRQRNAALSKIRCGVETVFAFLKRIYGFRRTRYTGLVRNQLQLTQLAISRASSTRYGGEGTQRVGRVIPPAFKETTNYPVRASSTAWIEICDHAEILSRNAM